MEQKINLNWVMENKGEFMRMSEEVRRSSLGEMMYKQIEKMQTEPEKISKVTGMLIDTEILSLDEILEMLNDDNILQERIKEALEILSEEGA